MSKIYEALKRAEAERASGVAVQDDFVSVEDRPATVVRDERSPAREEVQTASAAGVLSPAPRIEQPRMPAGVVMRTVATPAQAEAANQKPFLNELPADAPLQLDPVQDVIAPAPGEIDFTRVNTSVWSPSIERLPALRERGPAVEQFRSLRSRMFEFRDLNRLKSVMISSGLPQEGKSFVAANLAISFARHKASRVLLIDGDMRRSSLHTMLGCPEEPGLTSYLAGRATIEEILQRPKALDSEHPVVSGLASLTFIGGGNEGEQAADLSGNNRFKQLLDALEGHFDWIVVDSSPVNLIADGVNLARACDGVLLIVRGGVTSFEVAQKALMELKATNVLGVVLNAVNGSPVSHKYYGYDSYDSK